MKTQRHFTQNVELRAADDDSGKLVGYAARFDHETELYPGRFEVIRKGAFAKTVQEADVRALFNHSDDFVLGRTKSGTLTLEEDEKGLRVEIDPPDTSWANDLRESIRRGDIDQMSFGFVPIRDDEQRRQDGTVLRELLEVRLVDVSPVTFPAYPTTEISARSLQRATADLTTEQTERVLRFIEEIRTERTEEVDEPGLAAHSRLAQMRRRLRLAETSI